MAININDLPSELVFLIMQRLVDSYSFRLEEWSQGLVLLAVCEKWRMIGLPLVYRRIYIGCLTLPAERIVSVTEGSSDSAATSLAKITNLDLITTLGLCSYPRTLEIYFMPYDSEYPLIGPVIALLKRNASALQKVTQLDISMVLFMVDINNDSGTVAADKKLAEENAKEFIRLMPNVTKYIGVPTVFNLPRKYLFFATELARLYAPQLRHIRSNARELQAVSRFSEKLSSLELGTHGRSDMPTACINAASLKKLSLLNVNDNLYWKAFLELPSSEEIKFENLTDLYIRSFWLSQGEPLSNSTELQKNSRQCLYNICMPNLRRMGIDIFPHIYQLIKSMSFPEQLDVLVIHTPSEITIELLYVNSRKALNAMFCKILDFSSPLDGEIEIINRMLNTSNLALEISISLTWAHDTAMLDKINWTSLTQLDIIWQVNITELVAFTRKLPSLKRLKASRVNCTAHTIRVISLTLGLQDYDLTPLNTSIQKITLKCKLGKDVLANPVDDITEYLKARLAALKYIAVSVYKDR